MVTLYDIAKRTKLSPATVSKALNNYSGVKKSTYDLVVSTAMEMGYIPNLAARSLTTKKTWLVGILFSEEVHTGITHWHYGPILASAQSRLAQAGYDVVFISNNLGGRRMSYIERCNTRSVEGIIIAASEPFTDAVRCVLESDIKMVSVETPYENKYSVLCDNYSGTIQGLEYLYSLGHREIAFISCPFNTVAGHERTDTYKSFMTSKNLKVNSDYIVECKEYTIKDSYKAIRKLLEKTKVKPTAIFVGFGDAAIAAVNFIHDKNLKIPEDISLIGFDDTLASIAMGITTIEQDRHKIGVLAAELLINQIEEKKTDYKLHTRIETSLIERRSCKKII